MARYFTLSEANNLIPLVRELLLELKAQKKRADETQVELRVYENKARGNGNDAARNRLNKEFEELISRLKELIKQINEIGVEIKDIETGLIDFPAQRQGEIVNLCWKLGEDDIAYWHDLETGFRGRRPIIEW